MAQHGEMTIVERLEAADENEIVEAHENPSMRVWRAPVYPGRTLMLRVSITLRKRSPGGFPANLLAQRCANGGTRAGWPGMAPTYMLSDTPVPGGS
ncbi:MAG: hypothetical protein AMXMBFR59_19020 [Rhodanobacteraceae bacterium]